MESKEQTIIIWTVCKLTKLDVDGVGVLFLCMCDTETGYILSLHELTMYQEVVLKYVAGMG